MPYLPSTVMGNVRSLDNKIDELAALGRCLQILPSANVVTASDVIHSFTFVDCSTREWRTLDQLYANVKEAYSFITFPPLERSDHNLVHLTPMYNPRVKQLITDYIEFCVDITDPLKMPCFTKQQELETLLNKKKAVFRSGDREAARRVQRVEGQLQEEAGTQAPEEQHQVWRDITGYNTSSQVTGGDMHRANQLNLFFNRFETVPLYPVHLRLCPQYRVLPPVEII
ncbi:hypothetical protein N1851_031429 [Merluccius polli]|uniref:Uncharacterized protein n=1 Tax=Merluccius polli TaxID=89951 RepID=A0AA47M401_MERPO|nr:hypothetical protein N1851_031429 [Merluccius polli]